MSIKNRPVAMLPLAKGSEGVDTVPQARDRASIVSSRHLDLVLLACCSCLLTLMCHSTALLPQSVTSGIPTEATQAASSGQTNFYVKSALLSAYRDKGRQAEASTES